jgi:hypothetical protein
MDDSIAPNGGDVTGDLVKLMPRDLIFVMRFLGESQNRLREYFHEFIRAELARVDVTAETHPLLSRFIETHALTLRDFVFSGVALSLQLRLSDMERLLGDSFSLLRVDIWDQLRSHIETAERQFRAQAPLLGADIEAMRRPPREAEGPD